MKDQIRHAFADILSFLAIFIAPINGALFAIGFLIMVDTFTGIWGTWKRNGRQSVTSRKAGRIIAKLILYPLAIIISKVCQDYLTPLVPWVEVTAGIIAVIEMKSIFENMSIILGYDIWTLIKNRLWPDKKEN